MPSISTFSSSKVYWQFHGQVWSCSLVTLRQLQVKKIKGWELIQAVLLTFGSCLTEPINMKSQDILMQVKEAMFMLKSQKNLSTQQKLGEKRMHW